MAANTDGPTAPMLPPTGLEKQVCNSAGPSQDDTNTNDGGDKCQEGEGTTSCDAKAPSSSNSTMESSKVANTDVTSPSVLPAGGTADMVQPTDGTPPTDGTESKLSAATPLYNPVNVMIASTIINAAKGNEATL